MSERPEYVILPVTVGSIGADDCVNDYARQGYYLVSVTPLGRDGEFSPPRALFTMRLWIDRVPAVMEAPQEIEALAERVKALERYMGELVLDPQEEDPLVERLEALERRIQEIQALNSSRAEVINDQGNRIEALERKLDILWAEQPREVLP